MIEANDLSFKLYFNFFNYDIKNYYDLIYVFLLVKFYFYHKICNHNVL